MLRRTVVHWIGRERLLCVSAQVLSAVKENGVDGKKIAGCSSSNDFAKLLPILNPSEIPESFKRVLMDYFVTTVSAGQKRVSAGDSLPCLFVGFHGRLLVQFCLLLQP